MQDNFSPNAVGGGLLTLREVAGLLRLSSASVYRLAHAGRLPPLRFNRCMRFRRDDVAALIRDATPEYAST